MVEEVLEFRTREQVDSILARPLPPAVLRHLHSCYDEGVLPGGDRFGRPVYVIRGGRTGERLQKLFTPPVEGMPWEVADVTEAFMHWHLQLMEYHNKVVLQRATARTKRLVNKWVMLDDMAGMSTAGVTRIMKFVGVLQKMAEIDQVRTVLNCL
jgi:hypothetical protein